jgi:hypothetical protein
MSKIYLALYDANGRGAGIVKSNDDKRVIDAFKEAGFVEVDAAEYSRIQRQLRRDDDKAARQDEQR